MGRVTERSILAMYAPGKGENSFYKEEVSYEKKDYSVAENEPMENFCYYYDEKEDRLKLNKAILAEGQNVGI